jgi:hypothetical protein
MTWPCEVRSGPPLLLDHAGDLVAVRRDDGAAERAHDADGRGVAQAVGIADGDDGVADVDGGGVGEGQRMQLTCGRADADDGHILGAVTADHAAAVDLAVVEAHAHRVTGARDDVVVRDDVALGVDHEAGALVALDLAAEEA